MSTEKTLNWTTASESQRAAWVAEYVMGWKWMERTDIGVKMLSPNGKESSRWKITDIPSVDPFELEIAKKYPTDITAAFEVVEKLRGEGFNVSINTIGANGSSWSVTFPGEKWEYGGKACQSLPEAICKSALMAKGYKLV